jgi:hypothetical protein
MCDRNSPPLVRLQIPCLPKFEVLILMSLNIGRKEISAFFYIYMLLSFASLILDSGVIPPGSGAYPYFAAVQNGLTSALCVCLLINGFVGFQLYEDGTTTSVWMLRTISLAFFLITGLVSLATFKGWAGMSPTNTVALFVILYLVSAVALAIYVVMQIILVVNTLEDRWPLGDIAFGVFFFVLGQIILYLFSNTICNAVQHYLDGLFFATVCNLLAVMMVYKVHSLSSFFFSVIFLDHGLTIGIVLGFHHPRRSRILGWHQAEQLGSQRTPPRR